MSAWRALAAAVLVALSTAPAVAQQAAAGKATYDKWCAGCHGTDGKGDGAAAEYMLPRPRDFTQAKYQIRTTATGALPTDADILRAIDEGLPGTTMPAWKDALTEDERNALVQYVKTFSAFFESEGKPETVSFGGQPGVDIEQGKQAFEKLECWKCHGHSGRGNGPSAPTQEDDYGMPIRPADLTEPWLFNGGGTVEDIFHRIRTGMDGTPMPSYTDAMEGGVVTEDQLWNVAQYVHSLAPETPVVSDVVRARQIEGPLPESPDDSAWTGVERFYIPLVGQVIAKPRWFSPAVTGIWVQALHNGTDLALRLTWDDRSKSPDPEWADWASRVIAAIHSDEGGTDAVAAAVGTDGATDQAAPPAGRPDVIAVQFPRSLPTGMERPYFLMGDSRDPVYLWEWRSAPEGVTEQLARGLADTEPLPAEDGAVTAQSVFDDGQWRLVLRRPLAVADTTNRITFATSQPVPFALFAWDGDNGEAGTRGAISTWYFVYLEQPTPKTVYATPLIAVLLTAGIGLFAVGRAQRRERDLVGPAPLQAGSAS